ncbi:MAG TPA: ABC transporter permease, partial [Verrucomicrobiae bacterium]|nr:ABC transporter permease [Verrucomicrobiae bacterium]
MFSRFISDYGMIFVLVGLCAWFSWVTLAEQHPTGAAAGEQLARELRGKGPVLIVARDTPEDGQFVTALERGLERGQLVSAVKGQPADARRALEQHRSKLKAIACNQATANWSVFDGSIPVFQPHSYRWPNFLKRENLLNIANQIAVIAIVAIGMTMVIITRGIDLSVGSLIALAAVATTLLIRDHGAESASSATMTCSAIAGIALCAFIGFLSGALVTWFTVPAFIATLGMMLVASGLAFIVAKGQSIYQVPDAFIGLGRGEAFGIPYAVWLMALLYLLAHILMTHTALGRYIYAVGGNPEAARFSGVAVGRVMLFVYTV